ncbi:hypothetical protein Vafri_10745 [Volvox africanus]|uniref:Uncharacterized protein n=1 Tax=Volvox africanus TaxID=51714 RepID=A0A8J4F104_9CHLO|nr:hypothetical protein Vafri_10745 [Volvox africanus]
MNAQLISENVNYGPDWHANFASLQELATLVSRNFKISLFKILTLKYLMKRWPGLAASLHMLYGKNFTKALEVVDNGGIMCFVGERTGRTLYKVPGRRPADQYLVFPAHFCSCQSFQFDVVGRSEAVCVSTSCRGGPAGDDDDYDIPKWFKRGGAALARGNPAYRG